MKDRLSIPVAIATGIVPALGARRAPALTIVAEPVLTAVQNQAYSFIAQVQNAVGEAELTIIDAAPGLSVTSMGDNYFLVAGPITAFGSYEMVLRAEDGLERTAFLGPFTVAVRWQTLQEAWGAKNKGLMDHGDLSNLTLVSGRISEQHDPIAGVTFSQSFSSQRPVHDARGFGGYDGIDDFLEYAGVAYSIGAAPSFVIAVLQQNTLAADVNQKVIFSYGGANASSSRHLRRVVVSGVNRFNALVGTGSGNSTNTSEETINFSGVHIAVGRFGAAQTIAEIDGTASAPTAAVPATGSTRTRLAANTLTTASAFSQINLAAVAIADPLTTEEWNAGLPWLQAAAARFTA